MLGSRDLPRLDHAIEIGAVHQKAADGRMDAPQFARLDETADGARVHVEVGRGLADVQEPWARGEDRGEVNP